MGIYLLAKELIPISFPVTLDAVCAPRSHTGQDYALPQRALQGLESGDIAM